MTPRSPGEYVITNTVTGDQYVGSSVNMDAREKQHFWALMNGRHYGRHLQSAYNKYGAAAFSFAVLAQCSKDQRVGMEQEFIDKLNPVYNSYKTVRPPGGRPPTREETREKMSKAKLGKKRKPFTEETRQRMSEAQKKVPYRPRTAEEEDRRIAAVRAAVKGKPKSEEQRMKMSLAQKGRPKSPEQIAKMRLMRPSPETRARMSEAAKRRCKRKKQADVQPDDVQSE
jgi:group I intron endonuclease